MAIFITPEDKKRQENVLAKICNYQKCVVYDGDSIEKTKTDLSRMDYYLSPINSNKLYPIEIRCRTNSKERYPTFYINYSKWLIGKEIAKANKSKFFIFVQWTNGLYITNETNSEIGKDRWTNINGRNVMRDLSDVKTEVIHIPIKYFTKISD